MANEFLDQLTSNEINPKDLYLVKQQACLSVFRALPMGTRTLLSRMIFMPKMTNDSIKAQCHGGEKQLQEAIRIQLIRKIPQLKEESYEIDPSFRSALKCVIDGDSQPQLNPLYQTQENEEDLKIKCQSKWKALFNLISQGNSQIQHYRPKIRETFDKSKLLDRGKGVGFQFILSSTHRQILQILSYYVDQSNPKSAAIRFILGLSLLDPKYIYEMPQNKFEQDIMLDLQEIGLTQIVENGVRITYLLWNFLYEKPIVSIDIKCNIIVEANFRIYAYLESSDPIEEQILFNLLSLFAEIKKHFPNLIIADLTDVRVKSAFKNNMKSDQIIQFLEMNNKNKIIDTEQKISDEYKKRLSFLRVFQETQQQKSKIPHNVVQQLKFWDEEVFR
ncbi:hypothetical protein pb186bvf_020439 [Paramecium bursaria]